MNYDYIGQLFARRQVDQSGYRAYRNAQAAELLQTAGATLGYLIDNWNKWSFMVDRGCWESHGRVTWIKFEVPGGDRNNTSPRQQDPDCKKIFSLNQNPDTEQPVFEVHYGRILKLNSFNRLPAKLDWLEILTYLKPFQDLDNEQKMFYLQEKYNLEEVIKAMEDEENTRNLSSMLEKRTTGALATLDIKLDQLRAQIRDNYRARKEIQMQAMDLDGIQLELENIKRHRLVDRVNVKQDGFVIYTHQLPVIYFDKALYQKYKGNYYNERQRKIMDLVMSGHLELCTSPYTITLEFNTNHISHSYEYTGDCSHPHRGCQGDFSGHILEAAMQYDSFMLVSNMLQWFTSLAFDDSTVAQNWLFSSTGVRRPGKPETLVTLRGSESTALANQVLAELEAQQQIEIELPTVPDLDEI